MHVYLCRIRQTVRPPTWPAPNTVASLDRQGAARNFWRYLAESEAMQRDLGLLHGKVCARHCERGLPCHDGCLVEAL